MIAFHWVLGILNGLLAVGAVLSFIMYMAIDDDRWIVLARKFRGWLWAGALFQFNFAIWGSVALTIIRWK